MKLELRRQIFEKNPQISNVIKILPVGAELFYANGRTDEQTVAFRNFAKAPKIIWCFSDRAS